MAQNAELNRADRNKRDVVASGPFSLGFRRSSTICPSSLLRR